MEVVGEATMLIASVFHDSKVLLFRPCLDVVVFTSIHMC